MGFTFSLAREGAEHNITANVLTPIAASRLTQTVMTKDLLEKLKPDFVAPIVPVLTHKTAVETGSLFELGGGCISKFRWERSNGARFASEPAADEVLASWDRIGDFSDADHDQPRPSLNSSLAAASRPKGTDFCKNRIAIVIGAGSAMGAQISHQLAASGATVLLSDAASVDLGALHEDIIQSGGIAKVVAGDSKKVSGSSQWALKEHGRVDIVVFCGPDFNPSPLDRISDADWRETYDGQARAAYKAIQPLWESMVKNKYGRILMATAEHGLYGVQSGAGYAAASYSIVGFMRALFREGQKYNIRVNAMARGPSESAIQVSTSASLAACLSSDRLSADHTGQVYCVSGNNISRVRWQRTHGCALVTDGSFTPELVADKWQDIVTFDENADYPDSAAEGMARMLQHMGQTEGYAAKQAPKGVSSSKL